MKVAIKNIIYLTFLLGVILQLGCNESELQDDLTEPYVGTWEMYQVIKDGELQSEWTNAILFIDQTTDLGGIYELPETPYDTIWNSVGKWEKIDEQSFLINDSIFTNYKLFNGSLYLTQFLLWTSIPCDLDDPEIDGCPLVVTGQWDFLLARIN